MTNKLTGNGRPSMHLKGEVGQYYEDMLTGDLYECRVASEFSKTNGRPFGGYVWELRAKGEDIREIYGSAHNANGGLTTALFTFELDSTGTAFEATCPLSFDEMATLIKSGEPVHSKLDMRAMGNPFVTGSFSHGLGRDNQVESIIVYSYTPTRVEICAFRKDGTARIYTSEYNDIQKVPVIDGTITWGVT